jgi:ubiquinone/menaquinone biosynthesis C-methylase UbiE
MPSDMDEAFDFVCANGVIHHLPDPAGGLKVTARCTKKKGHAFVFVFSKNDAPWWPSIELMRKIAAPVPIQYSHKILSFYEVPGTKVFNTLDYSYTPIQHKLDKTWVEDTLRSVGFTEIKQLEGGVIHDAVLRCKLFEADRQLFGLSEIRYLLKK